jgi:hypothetical protein
MSAPAIGKSISFRPPSLYKTANDWGAEQTPPLNVSVVICMALKEFLGRRGVQIDSEVPAAEAELLARAKELIRTVGLAAVDAKLDELTLAAGELAGGPRP